MSGKDDWEDGRDELVRETVTTIEATSDWFGDVAAKRGLRTRAAILYICDPSCDKITDLAQHPDIAGQVTAQTLYSWAREDGWAERRSEFYAAAAKTLQTKVIDSLTSGLAAEVSQLMEIREITFKMLATQAVEPKSFEGLLKAFLAINRRIHEAALIASDKILPKRTDDDPTALPDGLDPKVADAMARAAIAARREEPGESDEDNDE